MIVQGMPLIAARNAGSINVISSETAGILCEPDQNLCPSITRGPGACIGS